MIVADRFAHTLKQLGVRRVYGLPGEDHMTLMGALEETGISYHTAYNESSAVIMAGADAQVSGGPGVVILSLAPGISNGINGLVHATMEGLPILVVSGQHPAARKPLVVRQGFDLHKLMDPVAKWSGAIAAGSDTVLTLCKALDVATADRPGVVYVELPDDVARAEEAFVPEEGPIQTLLTEWKDHGMSRLRGEEPADASMSALSEALLAAKRPALVVGGRRHDLSRETARRFSETFRCPVFTSSAQKGLLTSEHAYFAGTFLNGSLETVILDAADLILLINPEAFDIYNKAWAYDSPTMAVTSAPLDEWIYSFGARIVAGPDRVLRILADTPSTPASEWTAADVTSYRRHVKDSLLLEEADTLSVPHAVQAALSAAHGARIVADAGFSKPLVAMLSEPSEPGGYHASNALSTMGYAIPAALAAARASDTPVLTFLGDGSLLMRATELMGLREAAAPVVVVAIIDQSLSQIEIKQERRKLREVGVTLPAISCEKFGAAFDVVGVDASTAEEVSSAVAEALERGGVTLIGAHVDPQWSRIVFGAVRG